MNSTKTSNELIRSKDMRELNEAAEIAFNIANDKRIRSKESFCIGFVAGITLERMAKAGTLTLRKK